MGDNEARTTITGRYILVPNPCTTEPCLPGMAYAVDVAGQCYFLTVAGRWSDQVCTWRGWTLAVGDTITVFGQVRHLSDIYGNPILTIEADSLIPGGG